MARITIPYAVADFIDLRERGYYYVDKTEYVYRMTHSASSYMFLSRPRRFGKSLLTSTLHSYFSGREELFRGLAMEKLEKEWIQYPVLHFDMSMAKHVDKDKLMNLLDFMLTEHERTLGIDAAGTDPARAYLSQSKQLKGDKIGMKSSKLGIRLLYYFGGFFVMTIGIALSVKSNLGVSPVSSIPYTMTCVWGIEMGVATVIFHVILVILQMLLMRRRFECKNLLQIPVGMVFGAFTTTCNTLAAMLPSTDNLIIRLLMCWIATVFVAIGIFFYVPADIMPLAGEGAMLAISTLTGKPFPTVKIAFDVSMVIISLITCLIFLHGLGSVGIGTVIAALLVGIELRMITHRFGRWRDKLLGKQSEI